MSAITELTTPPIAVPSRRRLAFTVVALGVFMAQLDLFIVNIAFPSIALDFPGSSNGALSWVLNAYAIVFAACLVPAGRLGTPEEYGDLVAFICSERAGYLTGTVIPLDGGRLQSA